MSGLIRFVDETGSTNADLAEALRGAKRLTEGEWLVARRQRAGKGRQGREWFDGAGNFMGSTTVETRDGDPPPASLSFVAGLSVFSAARHFLPDTSKLSLKWPNDVLLDDGKLSGILLEMVGKAIVVGIGVNLAQAPTLPDRKTSALSDVIEAPSLEAFADALAQQFSEHLTYWRSDGLGPVLERFLGLSIHAIGSALTVHDTDGSRISGTYQGLAESDGALRLRLADGSERVIRAGDIE